MKVRKNCSGGRGETWLSLSPPWPTPFCPAPPQGKRYAWKPSALDRDPTECSLGALHFGDSVGTRTTGVGKSPNALLRQALRGDATWLWAQRGDNVQDELHDGTGGLAQELMGPGARSPRRNAGTRRRMWVKDLS